MLNLAFNVAYYLQLILITVMFILILTGKLEHPVCIFLATISIGLGMISLYYETKKETQDEQSHPRNL
jgi:5-bromo-4-chloroindolyl phosphate hydrolysis protein